MDRFPDWQNLPDDKQHLASPSLEGVCAKAMFDLEQVDDRIKPDIDADNAVCFFGSSFNPVTLGHKHIVQQLAANFRIGGVAARLPTRLLREAWFGSLRIPCGVRRNGQQGAGVRP